MAFKITAEEKQAIIKLRQIEGQNDERYIGIIGDLRGSINMVADSLRDLEDYMMEKTALKDALDKDFDKVEKFIFDSKNLIKKMERLNVVVNTEEEAVSQATRNEALTAAQQSCLEVIAVFDQDDDNVVLDAKASLESQLIDYGDAKLQEMFDKADAFLNQGKAAFIKLETAIQNRM